MIGKSLYVIKKYIYANSALEAIRKEKKYPVDDVWMDDTSRAKQIEKSIETNKIGFI